MIILFGIVSIAGIRNFILDLDDLKQVDEFIDEYEKNEDDDEQE